VPTTPRSPSKRRQDVVLKKPTSQEYLDRGPKVLRKYLRRQDKQRKKTLRVYGKSQRATTRYNYTKVLFALIIIISITALFFDSYGISQYIYLSFDKVLSEFTVHTFLTSLFISTSSFGDSNFGAIINIFFLFFMLFFLYFIARNIEYSYGAPFLIKLFIISGLFSALFYILLRLSLLGILPLDDPIQIYVGLAWGGLYGIISYIIFPMMSRKVRAFMTFIPMRMSGRSFLITIVSIRLMFGLLYAFISPVYILFYFPELGGILGSYLVFKYKIRSR
jgi:membrane associated rhomboid family serine protease